DASRAGAYEAACRLRRQVAFANPLRDFDAIIFLKHHRARYQHMVDQYYGFHAEPGGGVFVLRDAFGASPTVVDVLERSVVQNGRREGRTLAGGSFISLDLSWDGRTILFAWTEAAATVDVWSPESTYHVFRANVDGTALVQLTDGSWNDFDPCFMPDGRVVFVSERRGGYLRCSGAGGRPNPTYTMHTMNLDGGNISRLSFHETHEWHPSIDNDGMVVYTRWDYVDRDSDIAHHIWTCAPDGRDPRSFHGNYPEVREMRPWMEMSIRAIPGSHKYVAAATPHHGQNYGSLVLIDGRLDDDHAMSQVRRITPDAMLPESEVAPGVPGPKHAARYNVKAEVYGTPWPLSEDYYLCVYDPGGRNYGLYLLDSFGNRELLYRDPLIACLDPIPLRARPRPPVIAGLSTQATDAATGQIAVMNVYDSDFDWPVDAKVTALRVVQLFPKATPREYEPNIGAARQSLARGVLGTVPVEADGSACFEAPAGVPLYFQAIDERGMAIQSMRSDTYVHRGQSLVCQGCHEPKRRAASKMSPGMPAALRRAPSQITPEAEGSYPLSYPRLVQPVLDAKCVACHRREKACDLGGEVSGKWGWSKSFENLSKFGWARHGGNGAIKDNGTSRSIAGQVGARASKLYEILEKGHYDVQLSAEEMRRITLWLDCNTNFFGAYHDLEAQARGELVMPTLE
ncbi:MAG: PD40 domain-containing protein, partial [Phycisphaerae bacterium]|nr:PD40 domain-containing protein [Phycisphaerae bacterium]